VKSRKRGRQGQRRGKADFGMKIQNGNTSGMDRRSRFGPKEEKALRCRDAPKTSVEKWGDGRNMQRIGGNEHNLKEDRHTLGSMRGCLAREAERRVARMRIRQETKVEADMRCWDPHRASEDTEVR
jgi:hypothetical protein